MSRAEDGAVKGAMSVLCRKFKGLPYVLMYSARGPVCGLGGGYGQNDPQTLAELLNYAREYAKKNNAYVLKIDPDVAASEKEFTQAMHELGFKSKHGGKNFEGIQPNFVFRLGIKGKTEDELLASFHQKTRYNIRLAVKKGVTVKKCGKEALDAFSEIMKTTGLRDGFVTRPKKYFEKIMDSMGDNAGLYMAYSAEGVPIAGTLEIFFGNKAWYLYGASANEYRNLMPNYLLQWTMIKEAVARGLEIYDFRGVSGDLSEDNPLYGLYKFKKGFNGDFCEFAGEFEYSPRPAAHFLIEKGADIYRVIRRKLYLLKER